MYREEMLYTGGSDKELRELTLDLINGSIDLENYPVPESEFIRDEFQEGLPLEKLYSEAYDIRLRLYDRLGSQDDKDVDCMMNLLLQLGELMSLKMFDYGWFFAKKEQKNLKAE